MGIFLFFRELQIGQIDVVIFVVNYMLVLVKVEPNPNREICLFAHKLNTAIRVVEHIRVRNFPVNVYRMRVHNMSVYATVLKRPTFVQIEIYPFMLGVLYTSARSRPPP